MRRIYILLAVLFVFVLLFVIVFANLNRIVNSKKGFILARAEKVIGRRVAVDKISVTLRGGIGIRLHNFALADAPAFSSGNLLEASDLQINAKLWPLFKREFQVKKLILHSPVLTIIRNEHGDFNFNTLATGSGKGEAEQPTPSGRKSPAPPVLAIALVNIDNGEILLEDRKDGSKLRIANIDSHIENLEMNHPVNITAKASVFSDDQNVKLKGYFGPLAGGGSIEKVPVEASIELDKLDVEKCREALTARGAVFPDGMKIGGQLGAEIDAKSTEEGLGLKGKIDAASVSASLPERFEKRKGTELSLTFDAIIVPDEVRVSGYTLNMASLALSGDGVMRGGQNPTVMLNVKGENVNLSFLENLVPMLRDYDLSGVADLQARVKGDLSSQKLPEVDGVIALRNGGVKVPGLPNPLSDVEVKAVLSGDRAQIEKAVVRSGSSTITATARIQKLRPVRLSYHVTSPVITLSDFRSLPPGMRNPQVLKGVVADGQMEVVNNIPSSRGSLASKDGVLGDFDYKELKASFVMNGSKASIDSVSLQAAGGKLSGSAQAELAGSKPTFTMNAKVRNARLADLLSTLPATVKNALRGELNMDVKLSGEGKEWKDIKKSLSGSGLTKVFKGEFINFNIVDKILSGFAQYPGLANLVSESVKAKYPKSFRTPNTEFKNWESDFVIEKGKLMARNLVLSADDYTLIGKGYLDFDRNVDLTLTLFAASNMSRDLAENVSVVKYFINKDGRLELPLLIEGMLPKIRVTPDQEYIRKTMQEALLQKGTEILEEKGLKKLLELPKKPKK
jgi:uncharacterized protein involved in outer membrane biogenesis